jgi:eukaryotic-like serine/threonine-protein kinase
VKTFARGDGEISAPFPEDNLTRPGNMVGTPEYVAPEQALGDPIDARADIYSFGVLLFTMIAGRIPFQGETLIETLAQHFRAPIPFIDDVAPGVNCPPEIEDIIRRCMAKIPDERFASMAELHAALKSAWRHITDESFGTETSLPPTMILAGPAPIGLRALKAPADDSDDLLATITDEAIAQDPSEVSRPKGKVDIEAAKAERRAARMRVLLFVVAAILGAAVGAGLWLFAGNTMTTQPPAQTAPVIEVPQNEPPAVEEVPTIEPLEAPKRPTQRESYKDNPF